MDSRFRGNDDVSDALNCYIDFVSELVNIYRNDNRVVH